MSPETQIDPPQVSMPDLTKVETIPNPDQTITWNVSNVEIVTDEFEIYDASSEQRYEWRVAGEETAHIYKPLGDDRYLKFLRSVKARGTGKDRKDNYREALTALFRDQIKEVENLEVPAGEDFRDFIDYDDELEVSMETYLRVLVVEPEKSVTGKRVVTGKDSPQIIHTEAFFNGKPSRQTHTLVAKTLELSKKCERIRKRIVDRAKTTGLSKEAEVIFVPQDESFGQLYDEMFISATGFAGAIPLRFKAEVIDYVFRSKLDQKK